MEWAKELAMDLSARVYNVMLFKVSVKIDDYETPKQAMQAYAEVEEAQNVVPGVYCFRKGVEGWAFLVMGESRSHSQESIQELKQYLIEIMEKYPSVEYFGGIGSPVFRIRGWETPMRRQGECLPPVLLMTPGRY